MALCLRLPLQLPFISKYQQFQCCRYLMWSSLKKNGREIFSSPQGSSGSSPTWSPTLPDRKLEEMFENVGRKICGPYLDLLTDLAKDIPAPPADWQFKSGWTRYSPSGAASVEYPEEDALVFDVEVCVREGFNPTIAAAVSRKAWYLWVSPRLVNATEGQPTTSSGDNLITLGQSPTPRIVVGHFVSYDRARIKEQYDCLQNSGMRFFDTLSAHVSVSGVTNVQRNLMFSSLYKSDKWRKLASPNSLVHLSEFYCGITLNKDKRDIFVNGSLLDIAKDFQLLSDYCVEDVIATHKVFSKLLPLFLERQPHPVSLAGTLELSVPFLTVTNKWEKTVSESERLAEELRKKQFELMAKRADECLILATDDIYRSDPWMWDLNWKPERLNAKMVPSWYKTFYLGCANSLNRPDPSGVVYPGLTIPKILRLRCGRYPLHYIPRLGWGVIVPESMFVGRVTTYLEDELPLVPVKPIEKLCMEEVVDDHPVKVNTTSLLEMLEGDLYWRESSYTTSASEEVGVSESEAAESVHELLISNRTVFRKLFNVGGPRAVKNPLGITMGKGIMSLNSTEPEGKDFLVIRDRLLPWLTYRSRWTEQNVVRRNDSKIGVILPLVDVCADYLRLPKDRSWTPLFSLQRNQVGAALLKCVEAPKGHLFVELCFDNLDLWFASLFSDMLKGSRGSTKFSAYFLSGVLFTEMASDLHISTDEARCFCHAVVAGADTYMLSKLICQSRVDFSREEAFQLACKVMDLLIDYELISASPNDSWPNIDSDELFSPLLGCRLTRPLELEKKRVRLRAQWLIHSSKADFLHLFLTYHRSLQSESKLCYVHGDVRCLYLVPSRYAAEESFNLAHQAVQSFVLSRLGLPPHRNDPSSRLISVVSRKLEGVNERIQEIINKMK